MSGGDDGAILIVGMMACVCSVVLSAGLTYTCTGGSFDPDDFDTEKCLELFPEDTSDGGGSGSGSGSGGSGSGSGSGGSGNVASSQHLTICGTQFFSNESRTCFTGSEQVGVRWAWLNNDTASSCREKVAKYLVEVSSSMDNHNTKKMYNVLGKDANSVIISGASSLMTSSGNAQNVKIYITPLDASGAKISETAVAEVDTGSSDTDTCDAIGGTAVPLANFVQVTAGTAGTGEDCSGGTWSPPGPCMADDGVTELTGEVGKCGTGSALLTLSGQTPASAGGTCVVEKRDRCTKPCPVETPSDCVLARLPNVDENWNPYPGTPDYNATCKQQCEASGATTEEIYASVDVMEDAKGTGNCHFSQITTCTCPKDCVGYWNPTGSDPERKCTTDIYQWGPFAIYDNKAYVVTTDENLTGKCPNRGKRTKTRGRMYSRIKTGPTSYGERDYEISADRRQFRSPQGSWVNFTDEHLRMCPETETVS